MSELTEIKQVPYKCDKCGHNDVVEAVIKRKPQTVVMEDLQPITSKKEIQEMFKQELQALKPPVEAKPEVKEVPSYLPKHFCKGKGCEGHDNKARKRITKKCSDGDCGQVAPENAGKCAFCGNKEFDDLDEDELEFFNKGLEHEHSHED